MNIACAVCCELFTPSCEIYCTPCGHIFHKTCLDEWLKRNQTCPQCRKKTTKATISRLFFNTAHNESIREDAVTLQEKNDNLSFKLMVQDKELATARQEKSKYKSQVEGMRAEVHKVESQLSQTHSIIHALQEQLRNFKGISSEVEGLKKERDRFKNKVQEYRNIQMLMDAPADEINDILQHAETSSLVTYCSVLKREISSCMAQKRTMREKYRKLEKENAGIAYKYDLSNKEIQRLRLAEKELDKYKMRCAKLQSLVPNSSSIEEEADNEASVENIYENSVEECAAGGSNGNWVIPKKRLRTSDGPIVLGDSPDRPTPTTPKVRDLQETIVIPDSPELSGNEAKENSTSQQKTVQFKRLEKPLKNSVLSKKPRLDASRPGQRPEQIYDGLGGHSRYEIFPSTTRSSIASLKKRSNTMPSTSKSARTSSTSSLKSFFKSPSK